MTQCLKAQSISAFATNASSTRVLYTVYVPDAVGQTTPASCGFQMMTNAEYEDVSTSAAGRVDTIGNASIIAFALFGLLAVGFTVKAIKAAMMDAHYTDEKF